MNELPPELPIEVQKQIDLVGDEFEVGLRSGKPGSIAQELEGFPDLHREALFRCLLEIELEVARSTQRATPDEQDYAAAFPDYRATIRAVFEEFQRRTITVIPLANVSDSSASPESPESPTTIDCLLPPQVANQLGSESMAGIQMTVGPYKLLQLIGHGGMGQVYMAEQTEPVRRRVALKIIKADSPTREVLARFEAERQALTMMDHPNIAKVLDAGMTDGGRPYFAMELVRGVPITDYCDTHKLSTNQRLELFIQTCRAIQHAHQKGIIHRDIKPSNVLVTLSDGRPVAKVIDFGLAKSLQESTRLSNRTLFTQFGQVVGTLAYMSPEQAKMNVMDVDTRTDVYSLGVILYELLTGSTPISRERIRSEAFDRILAMIREEEPPRPSTRLSESGDAITEISEQRRTEPRRLNLILKGDLDWIAIKALEKDRSRRYEGPAALASDVERYLNGEAIEARPPSQLYRIQKAIRRHRVSFTAAAALLMLLVTGLIVTGVLWRRAVEAESLAHEETQRATRAEQSSLVDASRAREAEKNAVEQAERALQSASDAKAVLEFLNQHVLAAARPEDEQGGLGTDVTLRAAIDQAEPLISRAFRDQPLVEASVRNSLGVTFQYLGDPQSVKQLERSRQIRLERLGSRHLDTIESSLNLAQAYLGTGEPDRAAALLEEQLENTSDSTESERASRLRTESLLGEAFRALNRLNDAIRVHDQVLNKQLAILGREHHDTLETMKFLAVTLAIQGDLDRARTLFEEVVATQRNTLGEDHPQTAVSLDNLAGIYSQLGRYDKSLPLANKALMILIEKLGPQHPTTLECLYNLHTLHMIQGGRSDASEALREWLDRLRLQIERETLDSKLLRRMSTTGVHFWKSRRFDAAIAVFEALLETQQARLARRHDETLKTLANLGINYCDAGHAEIGIPMLEVVVIETKQRRDFEWAIRALQTKSGQAESAFRNQLKSGNPENARGNDLNFKSLLGASLLWQARYEEAEPLLLQVCRDLQTDLGKRNELEKKVLQESITRLVHLYTTTNRPQEAAVWQNQLDNAAAVDN